MKTLLTFDCYGTLLDTAPLYAHIGAVAAAHGRSDQAAKAIFAQYEDRLMYGEDYIPYQSGGDPGNSVCRMGMIKQAPVLLGTSARSPLTPKWMLKARFIKSHNPMPGAQRF